MNKKLLAIFGLMVIVLAITWGLGQSPVEGAVNKGSSVADFVLPDLAGKNIKLSAYQGKVILLNFWASWCPPCRSEMPDLQKLSEKLKSPNFKMLAVSFDRDPQAARSFIKDNGYTFPVLLDPEGQTSRLYGVASIPTTYIINKKGIVVERRIGAVNWTDEAYVKLLGRLLRQ